MDRCWHSVEEWTGPAVQSEWRPTTFNEISAWGKENTRGNVERKMPRLIVWFGIWIYFMLPKHKTKATKCCILSTLVWFYGNWTQIDRVPSPNLTSHHGCTAEFSWSEQFEYIFKKYWHQWIFASFYSWCSFVLFIQKSVAEVNVTISEFSGKIWLYFAIYHD